MNSFIIFTHKLIEKKKAAQTACSSQKLHFTVVASNFYLAWTLFKLFKDTQKSCGCHQLLVPFYAYFRTTYEFYIVKSDAHTLSKCLTLHKNGMLLWYRRSKRYYCYCFLLHTQRQGKFTTQRALLSLTFGLSFTVSHSNLTEGHYTWLQTSKIKYVWHVEK